MTTHPRYVCIHGHFYQPPRENPWLESIESQESATPYHDWNERITAECYRPNSAARIQDNDGHIIGIINNYARMSFNFGPTLLSWMETHSPDTYQAILDADKESIQRFGGHGSALAQVYNHIIMPLANHRDMESQILWGLKDFEQRFGRKPEGMWLAEAAVNTSTLELLAANGIQFTILAPNQAKSIRPLADNSNKVPDVGWENVSGGRIDPARPYHCSLPSGNSIALFFYDGPISQAVAFEGILNSGETFANRLVSGFSSNRDYPQLLHIATDGETYGHHHKFGEMALAYALHYIEATNLAKLTNYGQFLEIYPPKWEVRISENTSWSCAHGVERWSSDCGCSSGMHQGWSQQWRHPLRVSLDWLRDEINVAFERKASQIFHDPWLARNAYIDVVLNRNPETVQAFLSAHTKASFQKEQEILSLCLMELQRQMMLMYTSCGWFFDELSGLETVQILQYASRAIQLAEQNLELDLEKIFITRLSEGKSNIPDNQNGAVIYNKFVRPAKVDLIQIGAHYAIMNLFSPDNPSQRFYAFSVKFHSWDTYHSGNSRLAVGHAQITSNITYESTEVTFAVLHLGDHNLTAGVRGSIPAEQYDAFHTQLLEAFNHADLPQLFRLMDQHFFGLTYTLASLFRDERQLILGDIIDKNLDQAEVALQTVFDQNAAIMRFLVSIDAPQPEILRYIGQFLVTKKLRQILEAEVLDYHRLLNLVQEASEWNFYPSNQSLEVALKNAIEIQTNKIWSNVDDIHAMQALTAMSILADHLSYPVNFWQAQNIIFNLQKTRYPQYLKAARSGDPQAQDWLDLFLKLANQLKVKIGDEYASLTAE